MTIFLKLSKCVLFGKARKQTTTDIELELSQSMLLLVSFNALIPVYKVPT